MIEQTTKQMLPRSFSLIMITIIIMMVFYPPLKNLISLSLHRELYSHIVLMPFISGFFLYWRRKNIFSEIQYSPVSGLSCITIGILLYLIARNQGNILNLNDYLSIATFAGLTIWIGHFILLFGGRSFRRAASALIFLVFMVPVPTFFMEHIILFLQKGSAETAYMVFQLTGIPMFRDGFTFHFSTISVEVAEQCSGIRSSIALMIMGIILGNIYLKSGLNKIILALSVIPLAIFKNGLRIVTLSLLALYVDDRILASPLHRQGGIIFFLAALSLLMPILWLLRRTESEKRKK
jgi:exosortase